MLTPYYDNDGITLFRGDCLDIMPQLIAMGVKIDATICDIPYGTTACSWDTVIPFVDMWRNIKALNKPKAATVLFGSQPFTSLLVASNIKEYKYDWVWQKDRPSGAVNANIQPMRYHEIISVFSDGTHLYNAQKTTGHAPINTPSKHSTMPRIYGDERKTYSPTGGATDRYPGSIQKFNTVNNAQGIMHPTQKPVALMQYLIRTYTNPGDTVLDFTCGSGTTLLAAKLEGRKCIGIERDTGKDGESLGYCEYAVSRLAQSCMVFV